jgi:hypothetical protein
MKGVRRVTTGRSIEGKQHQIPHGRAMGRIVDSKVITVTVPRLAPHHLACKAVQTAKLDRPQQCHQGTEDLELKGLGNKNTASSKMTMAVVPQDGGLRHAGRAVQLAKLNLQGTEDRELIGHRQDMMEDAKSQKRTKNLLGMLEVLCHQQKYQWVAAKLTALINRDTALPMINSQANTGLLLLPVVAQLLQAIPHGLVSHHISRLKHMSNLLHTHSSLLMRRDSHLNHSSLTHNSQRYNSAHMGRNQMSNNTKEDHHMGDRLHRDSHRHMYRDIHMNSYSRDNALTKKSQKTSSILDDSSHTGNNPLLDKHLLMRRLLRMDSK